MPEKTPLLALADQQLLFRSALAGVFVDSGWTNTREVETSAELLDLLENHHVDILVIDLFFGDLDILSLCRSLVEIRDSLKVLLLTAYEREARRHQMDALLAGASGCLSKQHGADLYSEAIRLIARGMMLFQHDTIQAALRQQRQAPAAPAASDGVGSDPRLAELTQRELEILQLIAHGRGNPEIGRALNITENTVMKHVSHIMTKLKVRNRTEAAFVYLRSGMRE